MNKNLFIIIFCLINIYFSNHTFGQVEQVKIDLKWGTIKKEQISEDKFAQFAYFDSCSYDENMFPIYHFQKKDGEQYYQIDAFLTNTIFRIAKPEEINNVENIEKLSSDFDVDGQTMIERKKMVLDVKILPLRKNANGQIELLTSFTLNINKKPIIRSTNKTIKYATNSVLSNGKWYKLSSNSNGIYKITYNDLIKLGINPNTINPKKIGIFNNGAGMLPEKNGTPRFDDIQECAIYVSGEDDGVFNTDDYILYYGMSPHRHFYLSNELKFSHTNHYYSDLTFYFLTVENGNGKRITLEPSSSLTATNTVNSFNEIIWWDKDSFNLIQSGREWYGKQFDNVTSYSFSFNTPNISSGTETNIETKLAARSTISSSFLITINGIGSTQSMNAVSGSYTADYATLSKHQYNAKIASSKIDITIKYNKPANNSSALGWLNDININYRRDLVFNGGQLIFRDASSIGNTNISDFNINTSGKGISVWNVTDPTNITLMAGSLNSNTYTFRIATDILKEFVAFDGNTFNSPTLYGLVDNQNLHSLSDIDMVIVTPPAFLSEANRLADFHRTNDNLSVVVATPQMIYNEFSCGSQDISAIRDFMRMLHEKAGSKIDEMPQFLLLMGDGSYDFKNRLPQNSNFIPTYQSANSISPTSSFVSDDFFALLDSTEGSACAGLLDIGVGRFPVNSLEQAKNSVDKILRYVKGSSTSSENNYSSTGNTSNLADWRNTICFIADDEDNNLHINQADEMARKVAAKYPELNINKIYLDAYPQESNAGGERYPSVTDAFTRQVEKSALIINYTGHGGELGLAHERIIGISDINGWNNYCNMPIFMTATCEFSRWDNPLADKVSAGEYVFLNSKGGAIALFSTTRLVYASSNYILNSQFYNFALEPINGHPPYLGDIIRLSKNNSNIYPNDRNFTLLGDPALKIAYPRYDVITTKINQRITDSICDTIKALTKVTVDGHISNSSGSKISNFNGIIYPTIYDKSSTINTLGNDESSRPTVSFDLQKNTLYKGKAKVNNGDFSFSFIVPKDIAYNYGIGKISYYAENGSDDANGYYNKIIIGGSDSNAVKDKIGPKIEIFLNNENFVFGGLTDEKPIILAYVSDSNGINTVGNGIGHDIIATLDENTTQTYVLNDYYQADIDSYQKGTIRYGLKDLSEGRHTLKLKIWDIYNNSSEVYTEFIVAKSKELTLEHIFNYPNPFTTSTSFYLNHNQPCCKLDITINIFTISGKIIKTIQQETETLGYQINPIEWDGKDDFGDRLAKGVYIYEIKVIGENGATATKTEKLVIL